MAKAPALTPLMRRIESALKEGRLPQALELVKQFAKQEPGPASQSLLRKCYLKLAEVHVARGAFRDAHPILSEAEKLPVEDGAWWERLAELRADLGDLGRAMQLLEKVPGSAAGPRILGRIVDRAIREGPAGKELLPTDLKPQFELVRNAFGEYEAGRDDAAREALNGIGLSSPFLEWKLLIRGLIAWSTNDTARAVDNWSRLTPERLPARIAAPFRFLGDKAYAANLPANRYAVVSRQADQLSSGVGDGLRRLRKFLASEETIPEALETARAIVPDLKRVSPEIVPRLAHVVYWALVGGGQPEDMPRFNRIFGSPVDDPQFFRLQALVMEGMSRLDAAHGMWAKYEDWISKSPDRWPGAQGARARALILERMGRLARDWLRTDGEDDDLDEFFSLFQRNQRRSPRARAALKPSAEDCFRKASALAPDWVEPSMQLLREFADNASKAYPAVEDVLRRFPNNLTVLMSAADFYEHLGDLPKSHECIKRALAANPLDKDLRLRAAALTVSEARDRALAGEYDAAEQLLKDALELGGPIIALPVLALNAAIGLRAGNVDSANAQRQELLSRPNARLMVTYILFVELSRLKTKKKDLDPYQQEFNSALIGPATGKELALLIAAVRQYSSEPVGYRGLKAHQKKILDRVVAAAKELTATDLVLVGLQLHRLGLFKPLQQIGEHGSGRDPTNAFFPFFVAESMIAKRRSEYVSYPVGNLFRRAKLLIDNANDGRYQQVQELLDERLKATPDLEGWLSAKWGVLD